MSEGVSGPKKENIGISPEKKRRVDLVAQIRGIRLREASEEAWEAWLDVHERAAIQRLRGISGGRRRAVAA